MAEISYHRALESSLSISENPYSCGYSIAMSKLNCMQSRSFRVHKSRYTKLVNSCKLSFVRVMLYIRIMQITGYSATQKSHRLAPESPAYGLPKWFYRQMGYRMRIKTVIFIKSYNICTISADWYSRYKKSITLQLFLIPSVRANHMSPC